MEKNGVEELIILHFNDVYNLEEGQEEPVGGVARFKTALDSFSELEPLILFSGDLFQPSLMSTMYKGEQMIKPANDFRIDVACFGNHEFDIDINTLEGFIKRTNFPWILSNVKDSKTHKPLAGGHEFFILNKHGLKLGFVGLAEEDWLHLINFGEDEMIFEDFVSCSKRLTKILTEEHKCDLIIALTHMRSHNDVKLAEEFTGFDLILGGHDHQNFVKEVNGTYIIKSGSDFREFNKITLTFAQEKLFKPINEVSENQKKTSYNKVYHKSFEVFVETIFVTRKFPPDSSLKAHTDYYLENFQHTMKFPMGITFCELETRFDKIRNSEQNLSNFIADIMRFETESDCALANTGTIRSNTLFKSGILTMGDIRLMLPWIDLIIQLEITGEHLYKVLENSISKYPALEGRFPAISGISFEFDPKKEPMNRISFESIKIKKEPLDLKRTYTIAASHWISEGKDGYDAFKKSKILADESVASELHSVIKQFFELGDDPCVVELYKAEKEDNKNFIYRKVCKKKQRFYHKMKVLINDIVEHEGKHYVAIDPQIEGRIICKV